MLYYFIQSKFQYWPKFDSRSSSLRLASSLILSLLSSYLFSTHSTHNEFFMTRGNFLDDVRIAKTVSWIISSFGLRFNRTIKLKTSLLLCLKLGITLYNVKKLSISAISKITIFIKIFKSPFHFQQRSHSPSRGQFYLGKRQIQTRKHRERLKC